MEKETLENRLLEEKFTLNEMIVGYGILILLFLIFQAMIFTAYGFYWSNECQVKAVNYHMGENFTKIFIQKYGIALDYNKENEYEKQNITVKPSIHYGFISSSDYI